MSNSTPRISICVATRERPEGLDRLLESCARLKFERVGQPEIEVCVADNDVNRSAEAVCERWSRRLPFPLGYCHEPRMGIPFARNASLAHASPETEFYAFIDDDEEPSTTWLEQLILAQRTHQADIVCGPAVPVFPADDAPEWVMSGGFFATLKHRTGERLRYGATNNALVRREVIEHFDVVFDPRFALTGASDHHFFMRAKKAGFELVWCDTAVVREWIPSSRMTMKWILMRSFRTSSHHVMCEKEIYPGPGVWTHRALTGCGRLAFGVCSYPFTLMLPTQMRARALQQVFRGAGLISGLVGYGRYQEYATVHKVVPSADCV